MAAIVKIDIQLIEILKNDCAHIINAYLCSYP